MTIKPLILVVVLFAGLVPATAEAQAPGTPAAALILGSRVRVTTPDRTAVTGLVVAVDPQVVTLATDAGAVKIPVSAISAADISLGKRRNTKRGMLIGVAVGLAIGLLAPIDDSDNTLQYGDDTRGASVAYGVTGGVLYGAIIGALVRSDRWSPVDFGLATVVAPSGRPARAVVAVLRF